MGKRPVITKPSALANFSLGFEYDKTWAEAKHEVKRRTHKE